MALRLKFFLCKPEGQSSDPTATQKLGAALCICKPSSEKQRQADLTGSPTAEMECLEFTKALSQESKIET